MNLEQQRLAELKNQSTQRARQGLEMQRERILSQRTTNPGRRQALEAALLQIEGQIAQLG